MSGKKPHPISSPRIGLLGASLGTNNRGVDALLVGSVTAILSRFPGASIRLFDYAKQDRTDTVVVAGQKVELPLAPLRFSKRLLLHNNIFLLVTLALLTKLIPSRKWRSAVIGANSTLRELSRTELFASIAGGDSFSDIYGWQRLLYVTLPQVLVLLVGKQLVLLPQTFGPFRSRLAREIARYILSRAEMIYSRDREGVETVARLLGRRGSAHNIKFCYDIGVLLEPTAPAADHELLQIRQRQAEECIVGLNVSGLLFVGGYTHNNMFGLKFAYEDLVYSLVDYFVEQCHAKVVLVPHVLGDADESDSRACDRVSEKLGSKHGGKLICLANWYDPHEIKYIIGCCDFFVGSRMHACIGAVSQGVPAVAIAYSQKFLGVMRDLADEALVADARQLTKQEVLDVVSRGFRDRVRFREALTAKAPQIRQSVSGLLDSVSLSAPDAVNEPLTQQESVDRNYPEIVA
jgi:polysaccharide pyruvyl transferase WcaK-like protein